MWVLQVHHFQPQVSWARAGLQAGGQAVLMALVDSHHHVSSASVPLPVGDTAHWEPNHSAPLQGCWPPAWKCHSWASSWLEGLPWALSWASARWWPAWCAGKRRLKVGGKTVGREPGSSEAECPAGDKGCGPQLVLWAQGLEGQGAEPRVDTLRTHTTGLCLCRPLPAPISDL